MRFEERKFLPKDGRTCVLGPDSPEYAQEMPDFFRKTSAETEYLLRYPDEVKFTPGGGQAAAPYRKCGFIETGRRHNALKFDDASFHDEILMYKDL